MTQLWDNIQQWINNKLGVNLVLTNLMKLHGYLLNDQKFWPLNLILMITRKYIFWCAKNNYKLNIFFLQKEIKITYLEQETLSLINSQSTQFERRWNIWKYILILMVLNHPVKVITKPRRHDFHIPFCHYNFIIRAGSISL